jgi:hypothetical protein
MCDKAGLLSGGVGYCHSYQPGDDAELADNDPWPPSPHGEEGIAIRQKAIEELERPRQHHRRLKRANLRC